MQLTEQCFFYRVSISCVNPKEMNLTYEDRYVCFWECLKDDYLEKSVITVTNPDGNTVYDRKYVGEVERGIASLIYSLNDKEYLTNVFVSDHSLYFGIESLDEKDKSIDKFVQALEYSWDKAMSKKSLKLKMECWGSDKDRKAKDDKFGMSISGVITMDMLLGGSPRLR